MKTQPQEQASSSPSRHHPAKGRRRCGTQATAASDRAVRARQPDSAPAPLSPGMTAMIARAAGRSSFSRPSLIPLGPGDACPSKAPNLANGSPNPLYSLYQGMCVFDISWIDADTQLYFLADRSNQAIDVMDTERNKWWSRFPGRCRGQLNGRGDRGTTTSPVPTVSSRSGTGSS